MYRKKRRILRHLLVFFACVTLSTCFVLEHAIAAQQSSITVTLNGSPVAFSTPPTVIDGQIFLPLRELATLLDAHISWIPDSQAVVMCRGEVVVGMRVGNVAAELNGQPVTLPAPPKLVKGTVMVPLRAIAVAFGAEVSYADRTVSISLPPQAESPVPRRYYELIDRYTRDGFIGRRVWAKNYTGDCRMTVAPDTYGEGSIPVAHLEPLEIVAIREVDPNAPIVFASPSVMSLVQVRNAKGQTGWFTIYDTSSARGFHYREALEEVFFLSDPRKEYKWPASIWRLIEARKIQLGMTPDMVRLSWGPPRRVNRSIYTFGVHEQWVYGDYGPYLYFEDGKLTAIQD